MKRISWLLIVLPVFAALSVPVACVENRTYQLEPDKGSSSSTGGMAGAGGGSSSSTSSSSTGGAGGEGGGTPECVVVAECHATECKTPTACTNGHCVWSFTKSGDFTPSQLFGDCLDRVCDGNGMVTETAGDMDKDSYDWNNPCYTNGCNAASMTPVPKDGGTCTTPWGNTSGRCANLKCVDCSTDADCGTKICRGGQCIISACDNMMKDGNETDQDCGGIDCLPCTAGKMCSQSADCEGTCDVGNTNTCLAPACPDGLRNGGETDLDCGGPNCATKCTPTMKCLYPSDCDSGVCISGKCQAASCSDYTKNQNEGGIDCGGNCPILCPPP